ncbi:MAG: hypothetical protein K6A74_11765 [Lachnospiraceae bacterium]|nr:hypothetical protein [Lachnospiraceae bacterium]
MNVNGITNVGDSYSAYANAVKETETVEKTAAENTTQKEEAAAVYEPKLAVPTKTYKANQELITKLKTDAEAHVQQLQSIVQQLISKQAGAYADANDMWNFLREGKFEVDPETKAQAEKDIAEDGYWGVEQTSDRIVDFAMALTGGDPSKLESMREAFKKGYEQAEKTWGGKLPEISQKTYDAVMKKFDAIAEENQKAES